MPTKTIKADPLSDAGVVVSDKVARIHADKDNYLLATKKGLTLNGPISFVSGSAQMRFSGLWTMQNELMLSLPSTLATPTPVMTINPPIAQLAKLVEEAGLMIGLLGLLGTI